MHAQQEKYNFWKPLILWHSHRSMRDETVEWLEKKKTTGHIFRLERSYEVWDECSWPHSKNPDPLDRNGKIGKPVQEKSPIPNRLSQVKVKVNFLSVSLVEDVWQRTNIRHVWAFKGENIFWGQGIVHGCHGTAFSHWALSGGITRRLWAFKFKVRAPSLAVSETFSILRLRSRCLDQVHVFSPNQSFSSQFMMLKQFMTETASFPILFTFAL